MATNYYVSGSTARKYEYETAVPEIDPREERRARRREKEAQRRQLAEQNRIKREIAHREAAKRNRRNAVAISAGYMAFLGASIAAIAVAGYLMITTQASITAGVSEVAALKTEIEDLKAGNDARYNEITGSIDLNEIKDYAINELGMKYVAEDQIVYYSVEKNNYMDQYSDIPQ